MTLEKLIVLRGFPTDKKKNAKCSPLPEINVTVQGDWVWWIVLPPGDASVAWSDALMCLPILLLLVAKPLEKAKTSVSLSDSVKALALIRLHNPRLRTHVCKRQGFKLHHAVTIYTTMLTATRDHIADNRTVISWALHRGQLSQSFKTQSCYLIIWHPYVQTIMIVIWQ